MTLRAFRLVGDRAAQALDWLHVHADVRGAIEEDGAVTVWLPGPLPAAAATDLGVVELPAAVANATATGREADQPIQLAVDLLVRPPWVERPVAFAGIELVVPRGMAFGSGEHASTQAALLLLHRRWCAPASFADVGTGSGILAFYAWVRGCRKVAACDIEAAAVDAARALVPGAAVALGGPEVLTGPADCVVANMTAAELHAAWAPLWALWTRRAPLVLSGIRAQEIAGIVSRAGEPTAGVTVGEFTAVTFAGR